MITITSNNLTIEGQYRVEVETDGDIDLQFVGEPSLIDISGLYFTSEEALRKELLGYGLEEDEINDKIENAQNEAFDKL